LFNPAPAHTDITLHTYILYLQKGISVHFIFFSKAPALSSFLFFVFGGKQKREGRRKGEGKTKAKGSTSRRGSEKGGRGCLDNKKSPKVRIRIAWGTIGNTDLPFSGSLVFLIIFFFPTYTPSIFFLHISHVFNFSPSKI